MGIIKLPENFAKHLSAPNYINDCLNYYYKNTYTDIRPAVESRLLGLKTEWVHASKYPKVFKSIYGNGDVVNTTSKFRSFLRLACGYNILQGTFTSKNTRFELFTNDAFVLKINRQIGKKLTADHIFGTTEIGVQMFNAYENSDWDIKYIVEKYIPQTLYQNILCRMLITEHQKEFDEDVNGVARGKHTMEEKMSLQHYKEVNIPLPLKVHRLGIG